MIVILAGKTVKGNVHINVSDRPLEGDGGSESPISPEVQN